MLHPNCSKTTIHEHTALMTGRKRRKRRGQQSYINCSAVGAGMQGSQRKIAGIYGLSGPGKRSFMQTRAKQNVSVKELARIMGQFLSNSPYNNHNTNPMMNAVNHGQLRSWQLLVR